MQEEFSLSMVFGTERGRRRMLRSWEAGKGLNRRECTAALRIGQWLLPLSVCLLGFANLQPVSADGDNATHLPAASHDLTHQHGVDPHQNLSHRALAGGEYQFLRPMHLMWLSCDSSSCLSFVGQPCISHKILSLWKSTV